MPHSRDRPACAPQKHLQSSSCSKLFLTLSLEEVTLIKPPGSERRSKGCFSFTFNLVAGAGCPNGQLLIPRISLFQRPSPPLSCVPTPKRHTHTRTPSASSASTADARDCKLWARCGSQDKAAAHLLALPSRVQGPGRAQQTQRSWAESGWLSRGREDGQQRGSRGSEGQKRGVGWVSKRASADATKTGEAPQSLPGRRRSRPSATRPAQDRPRPARPATCAVRPCSSSSWPLRTRRSFSMALLRRRPGGSRLPAPRALPEPGTRKPEPETPRDRKSGPPASGAPALLPRRCPAARTCAPAPVWPGSGSEPASGGRGGRGRRFPPLPFSPASLAVAVTTPLGPRRAPPPFTWRRVAADAQPLL